MPTHQDYFRLIVYAPALVGDDGRPLCVVHGMERALPGLRLEWTASEKEDLIAVSNRDEWITRDKTDGGFPFLCNDDDDNLVTLTGLENPGGPCDQPQFEVFARLPPNVATSAAVDVLEAVAEGARAWWGHLTPFLAAVDIAEQTAPTLAGPPSPPRGLPALKLPDKIRSPEIPHRMGWLNYWSAAAARAIGFPDVARDAELLSRSRRTATGGWVVPITDAPLDLDNPAHLDALKRAYERFPEIGGRASP
ncbi:hypothetical protein ATI61_101767 [Archangium gephyra]|uniref:Immunity protein 52 domain-containing protein n=1 Tax=Archangium gephyra TaxID=48 RepID=A0ABX9KCC6_9BACT|nr:DUF5953 family protein [Archangium gephyra]REG37780.1 hypothetical protein ATI61_101767 [Archangium gephyra]